MYKYALKMLMRTHVHEYTYKNFLKTFLKQLCRINGVCRIMVLVAVICYAMLFMNNLMRFFPAKLASHHTYYLLHIQATHVLAIP